MKLMMSRAKKLRKNLTEAEQTMWYFLRKKQFLGFKFRRQVPIDKYIADFLCKELQLIIELDGGQHNENEEYDDIRTKYLNEQGYTVLRYWNIDVFENIDNVLEDLHSQILKIQKESILS